MTMKAQRAVVAYRSFVSSSQSIPTDFVAVCLFSSLGLVVSALAMALGFGGEVSEVLSASG